jgi:hypothetical protein
MIDIEFHSKIFRQPQDSFCRISVCDVDFFVKSSLLPHIVSATDFESEMLFDFDSFSAPVDLIESCCVFFQFLDSFSSYYPVWSHASLSLSQTQIDSFRRIFDFLSLSLLFGDFDDHLEGDIFSLDFSLTKLHFENHPFNHFPPQFESLRNEFPSETNISYLSFDIFESDLLSSDSRIVSLHKLAASQFGICKSLNSTISEFSKSLLWLNEQIQTFSLFQTDKFDRLSSEICEQNSQISFILQRILQTSRSFPVFEKGGNGLFLFLTQLSPSNLPSSDSFVTVTSSQLYFGSSPSEFVVRWSSDQFWLTNDSNSRFLQFDIKPFHFVLRGIAILTYHNYFPKRWRLLGFDDDSREIEIYKSDDDQRFNTEDCKTVVIKFRNEISCSRFRIRANGADFDGCNFFGMRAIEFYGNIRPN